VAESRDTANVTATDTYRMHYLGVPGRMYYIRIQDEVASPNRAAELRVERVELKRRLTEKVNVASGRLFVASPIRYLLGFSILLH
jgi:hypothetical protein